MSGWDVNYNRKTAECVYNDVQEGQHLKGFSFASEKLEYLKSKLENIRADAEWWSGKCREAAEHYKALREDVHNYSGGVSENRKQEAFSKSPQVFYDYAEILQSGACKVDDLISSVNEMLKKLNYAEESAEEETKNVLAKISEAIDLMDKYLSVSF